MRRTLGSIMRIMSIPMNRLKNLVYTANIANPKDIVNVELMQSEDNTIKTDIDSNIAAIMARMGLVIIPTNIALVSFPNPIVVNGRNYTLVNKQRVLLIAQTTSSQNGVYEVVGANLARVNDYEALDGIYFNSNQIGVNRWNDVLNALRFNGSGELQVKVKNTGTDIFGGWGVDPATGELYITNSALPGASGSLTIENYLLAVIGVAAKMKFSNEFLLAWDGANSRVSVSLNPETPQFPQAGGWVETFENSQIATLANTVGRETKVYLYQNVAATCTHGQEYASGILGYGQISMNPNTALNSENAYNTTINAKVNAVFNFFFRSKVKVVALANTHLQVLIGLMPNYAAFGVPADCVAFYMRKGQNSDRIMCVASKSSVVTTVNLGVGYENEGAGYRDFEIRIRNAACEYYIDGVLVATISTNLPNTATAMTFRVGISKNATQVVAANDIIRCGLLGYYYEKV